MASVLVGLVEVLVVLLALVAATVPTRQIRIRSMEEEHNTQNETTTKWPSLRFHFSLRRSSMNVYDQTQFDMFAEPAVSEDGTKVLYNVFGSFAQGASVYNYSLVDGVGFLSEGDLSSEDSSIECLPSESGLLPPINTIVAALNEAVAVSSISSTSPSNIQCSPGSLYKISVHDIDFAVCAAGSSGISIYGDDMEILVEFITIPSDNFSSTSNIPSKCSRTTSPSQVTSVGRVLLTGEQLDTTESRKLEAEFDFLWSDSACSCKSTPRPCIFIHGLGVKAELPQNQDSFEDYWGNNLPGHAPCCSSMKFAVLDMENNAWTSDDLQQKTCDRVLSVGSSSGASTISHTIVVAHSMGNLVLAGAIATGKCRLDAKTSTWVGISAPMSGSMASDYFQSACENETIAVVQKYVDVIGMCPIRDAIKSMASQSGKYGSVWLNKAYLAAQKVYQQDVDAVMCSGSSVGLVSLLQVKFWIMHRLVPFESKENDGMVEFESCAGGILASKFGTSWQNRFYKTELNHYDTAFRAGDGLFNKAKMPLKWFECLL